MKNIEQKIENEFVDILKNELAEAGYDTSTLATNDKVMITYFTLASLFLQKQKYSIHIPTSFICPEENIEGYENLILKMQNGDNFNPHLSRITKTIDKHDLMLYEWGIYHFHLGAGIETDGYISRTSNVLYAYIDVVQKDIYILGVFEHGKWADADLIEIIHKEFPNIIANLKYQEAAIECNFDSATRTDMRKVGINMAVTMKDGTTYLGPGMGITTAGTPVFSTLRCNEKRREFRCFAQSILKQFPNCVENMITITRDYNNIILSIGDTYCNKLYSRSLNI